MKQKIEMFLIPTVTTKCIITANDEINYFFKEAPGKCVEIITDFICEPFYRNLSQNFSELHEQLDVHESGNLPDHYFVPRKIRDFYEYQIPNTEKMQKFLVKFLDNQSSNMLNTLSLKQSEFVEKFYLETKEVLLPASFLRS